MLCAIPDAFTRTCSEKLLPSFVQHSSVHCKVGGRSAPAYDILQQAGYIHIKKQAVRELQQHLPDDLARVRGDQPCAFPEAVREPHRTWTQGRFVLQCYKELAQHHGHMELTRDVMLGQGPAG